jgi:adenylate cyclase class IV
VIEVEMKLELLPTSRPRLEEKLATMQFLGRLENSDTYYDTASFDLLSQAVFVRVRNHQRLEFKFNLEAAPAHIQSTERIFSLTPGQCKTEEMNALFSRFLPGWRFADTVEEALRQNSLVELAHIENRRAQYAYENLFICVDEVEGLGDFVEIEMQCEDGSDTHLVEALVQDFAVGFAAPLVRVGYVELWLLKHHPPAYQMGKYHE